jgi:hypothetical protein
VDVAAGVCGSATQTHAKKKKEPTDERTREKRERIARRRSKQTKLAEPRRPEAREQ